QPVVEGLLTKISTSFEISLDARRKHFDNSRNEVRPSHPRPLRPGPGASPGAVPPAGADRAGGPSRRPYRRGAGRAQLVAVAPPRPASRSRAGEPAARGAQPDLLGRLRGDGRPGRLPDGELL